MKGYKNKVRGFLFGAMIVVLAAWGIPKNVSAAEWIHQDGTIYCVVGNNVEMTVTELEQFKSEGAMEFVILQRSQATIRILGTMEIYEGGFGWMDLTKLENVYIGPEMESIVVSVDMYVNADIPEEGGIQILVTVINDYEVPGDGGSSSEPIIPSPDEPEIPEEPAVPEEPIVPEAPIKPENPKEPENPGEAGDLEEPTFPEEPEAPEKPKVPQKPVELPDQGDPENSVPDLPEENEKTEQNMNFSLPLISDSSGELQSLEGTTEKWGSTEVQSVYIKPMDGTEHPNHIQGSPDQSTKTEDKGRIEGNSKRAVEKLSTKVNAYKSEGLNKTRKMTKTDVVLSSVCGVCFLVYGSILFSDARLIRWFYKRKKQNIRMGIGG